MREVANFVYIEINKIKSNESSSCNMLEIFIMWGCVDLKDCFSAGDLSNIASTYIGIIIGAFIGETESVAKNTICYI